MEKKGNLKGWIIAAAVIIVLVAAFIIYWETSHGNRQLVDLKNRFDRAIIGLPNGEFVEGKVSSWTDYADSDVVQVTINGKTYLTSYTNVVLIND